MTTPISNANSSFYDPNAQFSPTDGYSGSKVSAESAPYAVFPREVTIAPVVITAEPGARQLVHRYDQARSAPDCSLEGKDAAISCAKAAITAVGGALLSTTVVGVAVAAAASFAEAVSCSKDLRAYHDCKTQ